MALEQFANNAQAQLAAAVTSPSATTITVTVAAGFPSAAKFRIRVDNELMLVTALAGASWTVTRGIEGTGASTHALGALVTHVLTAGALLNSPGPMTTAGDLCYLDATGTPSRLPIGTASQVLTVSAGLPAWQAGGGGVPSNRQIATSAPLTGGGDLSADRTLGIADFGASGTNHARGTVPDPGSSAGTTRFLREDATFAVPPGTGVPTSRSISTTAPLTGGGNLAGDLTLGIAVFVASGSSHAAGAVPDPGASAGTTKFLREDATWAVPSGGSGTVTSIVAGAGLSGGTITTSGTIAIDFSVANTQNNIVQLLNSSAAASSGGATPFQNYLPQCNGYYIYINASNLQYGTVPPAVLPDVVGDSGSGGTRGAVPAPAAGDTAANKFLKANGLWSALAPGVNFGPGMPTSITVVDGVITAIS